MLCNYQVLHQILMLNEKNWQSTLPILVNKLLLLLLHLLQFLRLTSFFISNSDFVFLWSETWRTLELMMGDKGQKWNAQEGQPQTEVNAILEAEKAVLARMEQKSATSPVLQCITSSWNGIFLFLLNHSSRLLLLLLLLALLLRFLLLFKLLPLFYCRPDLKSEELQTFAQSNVSILTFAHSAGTEPLKPMLRLQLLNRRLKRLNDFLLLQLFR